MLDTTLIEGPLGNCIFFAVLIRSAFQHRNYFPVVSILEIIQYVDTLYA